MKAPKIPSFFNSKNPKEFIFKPRYYNERKERIYKKTTHINKKIKFTSKSTIRQQKGRNIRIIFLIIILSLLAYIFINN
jgi:tetrahydromethanopterin S-methyltransferase subunit G